MPLVGTHTVCAQNVVAAKRAVAAAKQAEVEASGTPLTEAERNQLQEDMEAAGLAVLFAHMAANTVVAGTATGVTVGPAAVPVVGTIA